MKPTRLDRRHGKKKNSGSMLAYNPPAEQLTIVVLAGNHGEFLNYKKLIASPLIKVIEMDEHGYNIAGLHNCQIVTYGTFWAREQAQHMSNLAQIAAGTKPTSIPHISEPKSEYADYISIQDIEVLGGHEINAGSFIPYTPAPEQKFGTTSHVVNPDGTISFTLTALDGEYLANLGKPSYTTKTAKKKSEIEFEDFSERPIRSIRLKD